MNYRRLVIFKTACMSTCPSNSFIIVDKIKIPDIVLCLENRDLFFQRIYNLVL